MERLIKDAEKLNKKFKAARNENGELSLSYADIVDAIHIVQDEIGITGTTAQEASTTLQGSLGAMKASWQNLVLGFADGNADLGILIDNFVSSAETMFGNLLPIAVKAMEGIGETIYRIAPIISDKIPTVVLALLPNLLSAATSLVNGILAALPEIIKVLVDQAPVVVNSIIATVLSMLPEIIALGLVLILALADGLTQSLPELIPTIVDVVLKITEILTDPDTLGSLLDASLAIILALSDGIIAALPKLLSKAPVIIQNLVVYLIDASAKMIDASWEMIKKLTDGVSKFGKELTKEGKKLIDNLWQGIKRELSGLLGWAKKILEPLTRGFDLAWDSIKSVGKNIVNGLWSGISSMKDWLRNKVSGWVNGLVGDVMNVLGIHSPSRVFAGIGKFTALGFGEGFGKEFDKVADDVANKMAELEKNSVDLSANITSAAPNSLLGSSQISVDSPAQTETLNRINDTLDKILDKIGFDVVLDDGTIAGRIDKLLGQTSVRKARGNA